MGKATLLIIAVVLGIVSAAAQTIPALPPGAEAMETQLLARLGPLTRAWIGQEAQRELNANTVSDAAALRSVRTNPDFRGLAGADIDALVFLVMMQAAKSAQEDLKSIMAGVKQINDAKAAYRPNAARSNAAVANAANARIAQPAPATNATVAQRAPTALARPPSSLRPAALQLRPTPKAEFDNQLDKAKQDLDSMSEMGEMESLRLQMAMDRQSKMMSTLSNLLKKTSDTASTITQNLK